MWAVLGDVAFYWHLPILVVLISLVYSATRFDDWPSILQEAWRWGVRMVAFLVGIGIVLFLIALLIGNPAAAG
jgi:hypothetical protein